MSVRRKRIIALLLTVVTLAGNCFVTSASEEQKKSTVVAKEQKQQEIHIDCDELNLTTIGQKALYTFSITDEGSYNIKFTYKPLEGTDLNPAIAVKIDGAYPNEGLENTELSRWFKNNGDDWSKDGQGNEFSPEQIEVQDWYTQVLFDEDGIETEPYQVSLTQGEHTIEIESLQEAVAISKITFASPENPADYATVQKQYKDAIAYTGKDIVIHAEDAVLKSTSSLTAKSDNISANVTPQSPYKSLINYIGGANWSQADEILTWNFDVKESGLYSLHFHYKQSGVVNGRVFRWMKIDGETPFKEAKDIAFQYDTAWQWKTFGNEDEPYQIYLEEGTHTLTMGVTISEMSDYYKRLSDIVEMLGDEYLKISMITGDSPDQSRDYELFKQIPELEEVFKECLKKMEALSKDMKAMSDTSSTQYVSTINSMTRVLNQMLERKYLAHTHKTDFYNQYCSLSTLLYDMKQMPLSLDEIRFTAPEQAGSIGEESWWQMLWQKIKFVVESFFASFTTDYNNVSEESSEAELKLWVNWGRDQTQVLNSMIQESFTAETGIKVNVQTTDATVIQGMLTDNAPDIALHVSRSMPVNYAMRGAAYDLTQFEDYEEVITRFAEGSTIPYQYNGGTYALPDTQSFYIMYYREDILESIGVEVPTTWEEFIEATAIIQRNNMNVYLPYTKLATTALVNTGVGGLNIYSTLLSQNGVDVYNEELNRNNLDSSEAVEIFNWWTDMYTKYSLEAEQDFYNRFRVGVTPLGISNYTVYTTLDQTAPEIEGKWGIALIPGVEQEDGSINRSSSGSGTGAIILNDSEHKEEAWEFLKWWTREDVQLRYSRNVESLIGPVGRIATATVDAFSSLSWKSGDRDILMQQWEQVVEVPEVPGSYYLARAVDQAFWATLNGDNASESVLRWSNVANDEIKRKIEEYSD
jgi:ABC-type glycerol-3-phosphate transport system substrate-binding protein